ncbi:hypothetical protein FDP41_007515 [Naegleria fowleri]|uniref:Uncharacterized protein n=1 Tax=Naegleria fowleri TaxID=5763 RepID=A0A6A5CG72_NAEFO|nr:uncharacterized protein FDP41_007515 [Naegleria fowleri]KAF0984338.1 hypothetical protein FDP41_007515 [Naegleria fowleri]
MIIHPSRGKNPYLMQVALLAVWMSVLCWVANFHSSSGGSASCCWAQETNRMALNPSTLQSWELATSLRFCKRNLTVGSSAPASQSRGSDSSSPSQQQQGSSSGNVLSSIFVISNLVCNNSGNSSSSITSKQQSLLELQQPIQGEAPLESIGFFTNLDLIGFTTGMFGVNLNEQGIARGVLQLFSLVKLTIYDKSNQSQSQSSGIPPLLFPFSEGVLKTIYFTNSSLQNIRTAYGMKVVGGGNSKVMYYSVHADSEIGHLTATCFVAEEPTILNVNLIPANSTANPNKNHVLLLPESLLLAFSIDNFNVKRVMQMVNMNSVQNLELVVTADIGVLGSSNLTAVPQQQQQGSQQESSQPQVSPQPQQGHEGSSTYNDENTKQQSPYSPPQQQQSQQQSQNGTAPQQQQTQQQSQNTTTPQPASSQQQSQQQQASQQGQQPPQSSGRAGGSTGGGHPQGSGDGLQPHQPSGQASQPQPPHASNPQPQPQHSQQQGQHPQQSNPPPPQQGQPQASQPQGSQPQAPQPSANPPAPQTSQQQGQGQQPPQPQQSQQQGQGQQQGQPPQPQPQQSQQQSQHYKSQKQSIQVVPDLPYKPDDYRRVYSITNANANIPKGYLAIPSSAAFGSYSSGSGGGGAEIIKFMRTTLQIASLGLGPGGATTSSQSQTSDRQYQQQSQTSSGGADGSGGRSLEYPSARIDYSRLDVHIPLSSLTESEMSQDSFIMWGPVYLGHVEQQGSSCTCGLPPPQPQQQQ